ncbi:EsaB/YukD family protein [Pseudonocardia kujensis]|uniref:EsaB/YukD family protein n=1 Tax=Pseudonocardia kujensis TaxID=1128675 RepID=UPI001E46CFFC|nr:EsaB/YukD family protein [Pseudonocardia kujensis]MCE0768742.1 EsaB/YukD family protein [Pseudonocardia kujensis]
MDAYRRVTVLAPACRLDVALPADLAVAELVPMVRELLGEPVPDGRAPAPWRLDGAAGAPLPPGATLAQLGVCDGALLRIGPAVAPPPPPRFDDLPEALAAAVETGARDGGERALPLAVLVAMTIASLLLAGVRGAGLLVAAAAVVVSVGATLGALVVAARVGGRAPAALGGAAGPAADTTDGAAATTSAPGWRSSDGPSADGARALVTGLCALPPAAAAGRLLTPGSPTAAVLGAALLLALAAAAAQAVVRVVEPVLTAAFLVGTTTALRCVVLLLTGGPPTAAGAACAAAGVLVAPLLPRLALRLAGLPTTADDPPPDPDVRAGLARRHLAGLVLGGAVVTATGAVLAAAAPGPWGPLLAAAVCVVLLLRARGFAEALPARALQVAGLLAGCGAAVAGTLGAPAPVRLLAASATLGALLAVLALQGRRRRLGPVGRRTADLAELALTALCVPLAAAVLHLFALVRGW